MLLSSQCTSQSLSLRLKKLGVGQDSLWDWIKNVITGEWVLVNEDDGFIQTPSFTSAFTASEISEMLPAALEKTATWLTIRKQWPSGYFVEYVPDPGEPNATHFQPPTQSENLVEAMGLALEWILEQGVIHV